MVSYGTEHTYYNKENARVSVWNDGFGGLSERIKEQFTSLAIN